MILRPISFPSGVVTNCSGGVSRSPVIRNATPLPQHPLGANDGRRSLVQRFWLICGCRGRKQRWSSQETATTNAS